MNWIIKNTSVLIIFFLICLNIACDKEINSIAQELVVTVFLYENCPITQYMCGPLRDSYNYYCDTLIYNIKFQAFSPNPFSNQTNLAAFSDKYQLPFEVQLDYNLIDNLPGAMTQLYLPIVTPEVFIEKNGELVYRGMIDNSYQSLGQWSTATENYLFNTLESLVNNEDLDFYETTAVGCLINY